MGGKMPPIVFLYWNWLQGLVENRSRFSGGLLFMIPGFLWIFLPMLVPSLWLVFITFVLGACWCWPLMIFHMEYWKSRK